MQLARQHYYKLQTHERVCQLYAIDGLSFEQISALFGGRPCPKTVSKIVNAWQTTGALQPPAGQKGVQKPRKLDETAAQLLVELVQEHDQALLCELAIAMELYLPDSRWSANDISVGLKEMGYVRKRVYTRPYEQSERAMAAYRQLVHTAGYTCEHFVFFDEVATDDRTTNRPYAWVLPGELSKSHSLFVRGRRFTTIAAMSKDGILATHTLEGAATREVFTTFFCEDVIPKLQEFPLPRSVVVFDNCAIHSKADLEGACAVHGLECLFLPPYSPMYNPIEKVFGRVKQWIKSNRELVCQMPPVDAIAAAFTSITPNTCENWIRGVYFYDT